MKRNTPICEIPDEALVGTAIAATMYNCHPITLWRWAKDGLIPQPVRIGKYKKWLMGDLRKRTVDAYHVANNNTQSSE